ncbi:phosphonoacetaldehyde reductase [Butyrivibrio sp. TB]|uniref:phosphonoacetaldehyde reductase n=1 Tax=Butyrivibrio sp. TB TaxID=1520809 RepID=UPI0008AE3B43|nr:phosphonoacetaldehyde reductase [Butyrivibrio sp. TB]SEQ15475.1 Alcohol dehydrogenase, class IV [Butyrivibrio sp. TB]
MSYDKVKTQNVIEIDSNTKSLMNFFDSNEIHRVFLVCGNSFDRLPVRDFFTNANFTKVARFADFSPNPTCESVSKAINVYRKDHYDAIVAVGGGSAIDVAKCLKISTKALLIAVPTTAGSGAEATHFSVVYRDGIKTSVSDEQSKPDVVILWPEVLDTLPEYQRKSTMLDALCHAIESAWSVNSTDESVKLSLCAIEKIIGSKDAYLHNTSEGNREMLIAANISGKAIDIARTTAAHAMSYGMTTKLGIAHGHAVALCLSVVLPFVAENTSKCIDNRGPEHLENILRSIAQAFGCNDKSILCCKFNSLLKGLNLECPKFDDETIDLLVEGVNIERLNNIPVEITKEDLNELYRKIQEER